jgi:hypothetical protein
MMCARHNVAAGPDGRCALCHREDRVRDEVNVKHDDRRVHRRIRVVIAIVACVATYAILMAWLDTTPAPRRQAASSEASVP